MVVRKSDTQYTHLSICNYDTYQDKGTTEGTTEGQQKDSRRTAEGTQLKNVKNVKNEKKNTRLVQLDEIRSNLTAYSKKYPSLNIQFYFDSFVDWLDATGKKYKKYDSAFNNCCRSEWYKDRTGSTKKDTSKSTDITIMCPDGHYSRKTNGFDWFKRGVRAICPECHQSLKAMEQMNIEKAMT